jgi:hypothetical protein
MPVYLVINKTSGIAENAIKWDGESEYDPGEDYELEQVSGEPGCPWIGWIRNEEGVLEAPPEPVYIRYAVVKKLDGTVVDFKNIEEGQPTNLEEPASFEYALVKCEDETVQPGWKFVDGEFVE